MSNSLQRWLAIGGLTLLAACQQTLPRTEAPPLWKVDGTHNSVYLLGSIHVLRADDYPLPALLNSVYSDAERLLMELDMDEFEIEDSRRAMLKMGIDPGGARLPQLLGQPTWDQAHQMAAALDIDLESLAAFEPWVVALSVIDIQMRRLGFEASHGIESHFTQRAMADGKTIDGLETVIEQLALFDRLPPDTQSRMLIKSIDDAQHIESSMETLVEAWRYGDDAALEREMIASFGGFPALYDALVIRRNRAWVDALEGLFSDTDDYLVIVGALHLVGKDGVVELLRQRGFKVTRVGAN